ncbi:alpha/beta fold hydrolase [Nocardia tengchongensis]|uniref:alpha/beta fold hydrolase n=1 Tax=Nocardia tengchongensis TaxID=2055889 RepID=UPI00368D07D1
MAGRGSPGFRHISFDERARGKSGQSADYSFDACVRDVDAVLAARGVEQKPILVGWSYGALVAVHWADRNPDRIAGVVSADGAMPWGYTDPENVERIRAMFRKMGPMMPLLRPLGLAARMSAEQHAEINVELNQLEDPGQGLPRGRRGRAGHGRRARLKRAHHQPRMGRSSRPSSGARERE